MISHRHRCIFIHIPKTAGTSIEERLADGPLRGRQDHRSIRNLENSLLPSTVGGLLGPDLLRFFYQNFSGALAARPFLTRRQYATYFKFAFVRNPWARVYSWYRNVMRDPAHRRQHGIARELSLYEFLCACGDSWALRSQLSWLQTLTGEIGVDFIGRFESLEEDFAEVCGRLQLPQEPLKKLLASEGPDYQSAYDARSRELVAERYAEEIGRFGYCFDDPSPIA